MRAHLKLGQRLLIRGGAGGVGMIAVQIARALGSHVTALASKAQLNLLDVLGVDEATDYRAVNPKDLNPFDLIIDTVGTDLLAYRRRLTRHGTMVTIAFGSGRAIMSIAASTVFADKRIRCFSNYPDQRLLADLTALVEATAVHPIIDTVYPLERIAEAHRALQASGRTGKLVLTTAAAPQSDSMPSGQ